MTEPAEDLVDRARAGDRAALDRLVEQYTPLVWHVARSHALSREQAEDVVQDTWLAFLSRLPETQSLAELAAWLTTTARREALRIVERSRMDSQERSPEHELSERDALLWRAMQQLPKRCRELITIMIGSANQSYHDVATALSMPVGSIGPTRARCLKRLRELIETMGADDDVLATEDSLVRTLRESPRILDTVPPEVVEDAVRFRE
jgi:RNA polymerase sigma factor (sigma-70 family)